MTIELVSDAAVMAMPRPAILLVLFEVQVEVPHCSLDFSQIEVWILVGRELYVAIALRKPLDDDVREVTVGDMFLDGGESIANVCSLHDVMVWILV